jgi:hypothetical protein
MLPEIEPGFAADHLPLLLSTQSSSIRSIHAYEIGLYDDYPVTFVIKDAMGFGMPMDYQPLIATPGAIRESWSGQIRMLAGSFGVEIEDIRENFERETTDRTLEVAAGTIEAGTCGALRIQAIGVVDGRDAIIVDHVTRMAHDVAPEWPSAPHDLTHRVEIEGEPNISCDMSLSLGDAARWGIPGMTSGAGAMVATAMRVVNAIPAVVDASPGMITSLDLPLTTPKHVFDLSA